VIRSTDLVEGRPPLAQPTKNDAIAQWAFDTRPLLLRFHLWLEDVEVEWRRGEPGHGADGLEFVPGEIRRCLAMTAGVTALGTRLFAPFGAGKGADKATLNQVKKDADAISAYVTSEALWHFSRKLPENHAIMVSLGEGLMPKAGETPEMGANPLLGFGRVYARPQIANLIDSRVHRLLNDPAYGWRDFYKKMRDQRIRIWGAAVDTLENTSRFAKGEALGPTTVIHLFNQPLAVSRPYEAYMGTLAVARAGIRAAEEHSIHVDLLSPRRKLVDAIELAIPGIRREHIHVWTLGGRSRAQRLGRLWEEWRALGVHLVEDGWRCPSGAPAFTESGTYAPTYLVGTWKDETGAPHLFLCDGYAASAEAVQAASLSEALDLDVSMALFSPRFDRSMEDEHRLMRLDPDDPGFEAALGTLLDGGSATPEQTAYYRNCLRERAAANLPSGKRVVRVDDFFPEKNWRVLAATGYIGDDPYTGLRGVTEVGPDTYAVTTQLASRESAVVVRFVFRFLEPLEQRRLIFSPLLERFIAGEDFESRAVKVSDSGRIRNELQTLCSQALEYGRHTIRIHFDRIDDAVIPPAKKAVIRAVLEWYKAHHPVWFSWLEIA
jgi:hypothetical protein